jgi:hypothetical protein
VQRARTIILLGLAFWLAIGVVVELRYGPITTFVLAGWGGSGLLAFVFGVWPLGLAQRRSFAVEVVYYEEAAPVPPVVPHHVVEPVTDVVDLRDSALGPQLEEDVRLAFDTSAGQ